MFGITGKMFTGLLTSIVNESNHTKCVSLKNQKCMIQPALINLHPNYSFIHQSKILPLSICS